MGGYKQRTYGSKLGTGCLQYRFGTFQSLFSQIITAWIVPKMVNRKNLTYKQHLARGLHFHFGGKMVVDLVGSNKQRDRKNWCPIAVAEARKKGSELDPRR